MTVFLCHGVYLYVMRTFRGFYQGLYGGLNVPLMYRCIFLLDASGIAIHRGVVCVKALGQYMFHQSHLWFGELNALIHSLQKRR